VTPYVVGLVKSKTWGQQNVLFNHLAVLRPLSAVGVGQSVLFNHLAILGLLSGVGVGRYVSVLRCTSKIKFRGVMQPVVYETQ
jgi:hypothetical protein